MKWKNVCATASGAALALLLSVAGAFAQSPNGRQIFNSTVNPPRTGHEAALANPAGHPAPSGLNLGVETQWPDSNANFVAQKIAEAKARGVDTRHAEEQERMGVANLRNGQNAEATDHFDTALLALGIQPSAMDQNPGEAVGRHGTIPNTPARRMGTNFQRNNGQYGAQPDNNR